MRIAIVHGVVACIAQADQIPVAPREFRVLLHGIAVVCSRRRAVLSVSLALLAQVAITPENGVALDPPALGLVVDAPGRHHGLSPPGRPEQTKKPEPTNMHINALSIGSGSQAQALHISQALFACIFCSTADS